jgi:conjugative relaxase-like TrwC/TraI family protein
VTVRASVRPGYDVAYPTRGVNPDYRAGDYYRQASEHGEPPGRWIGRGAERLGLAAGEIADNDQYTALFADRVHPRDGVTRLGRRPAGDRTAAKTAEIYESLLAAEPHATAERKRELQFEAAARTRQSPYYFDLTSGFSKSISLFEASVGQGIKEAHDRGDQAGEARRAAMEAEVEKMAYDAIMAGFAYFEREAGYVRTGNHVRAEGREAGKWQEAALSAVMWLQHTSRDGDPQFHVHTTIAHVAETLADGKFRAPDNRAYGEYAGAFASYVALHFESALTRRFGLRWVPRADGYGYEIEGMPAEAMDLFSSRRDTVSEKARELAQAYEDDTGRKPAQRTLNRLTRLANAVTREGKEDELDLVAKRGEWAAQLRDALGVDLASLADAVSGHAVTQERVTPGPLAAAARRALERLEADKATWTRADVLKYLGWTLPPEVRTLEPGRSLELLEHTADRVMAGEFGEVVCLEAPQWLNVPAELMREDGRCVYEPHGGVKYASRVQLAREDRLARLAQRTGAPSLDREEAARLLGADADTLDAALRARAQDAQAEVTQTGLRMDQAAAIGYAVTSDRLADVLDAPAGSGKTTSLIAAGRAWIAAGKGRVIGVTPSQASRNTLAAGGFDCFNFAQFLGHTKEQRCARPPVPVGPGDLVLVDEASMLGTADLTDTLGYVASRDAKAIIAGDSQQLQAVENGGGMALLARENGYVQLAIPVRFDAGWERNASLRLRLGDATVLDEYDQHGRIRGGSLEQMTDEAAKAYVASYLAGENALLMTQERDRARELARRVSDDLLHLGVQDGARVTVLNGGAEARPGDLIIARKNNHQLETDPGHTLANGDTLRIEAAGPDGLMVRRVLGRDPQTGEHQVADRVVEFSDLGNSDLAYAITVHTSQSRTVQRGLLLASGNEDRQTLYVGMTRGTESNEVFVGTVSPKVADPQPRMRPAPELARHDRLERERAGYAAKAAEPGEPRPGKREAIGVLADILARDGAEDSAREYQRKALAGLDHLALLNSMWEGETRQAVNDKYQQIVLDALPEKWREQGISSHQSRWLYRSLSTAENAGLDPAEVVQAAVDSRDLEGSKDVASVLHARIRPMVQGLVPQPQRPWSERVPELASPGRQRFAADVARAMDERKERIGEHAAADSLPWAVQALGPVPDDPVARLDWQRKAADVGAYREMFGYDGQADAIGPEPAGDEPDKRAAWHTAFATLGPVDGADVRGIDDRGLWLRRSTYEKETAWAPRWVGDELRDVRLRGADARREAIRRYAEAEKAKDAETGDRHRRLVGIYGKQETFYREQETTLAVAMEDRAEWERVTEHGRRLAVAADAELRRRHPEQEIEPLRSAEPEPVSEAELDELVPQAGDTVPDTPQWVTRLKDRQPFQEKLDERKAVRVPAEDHEMEDEGEAWPVWREQKEAILQPPKPEIPVSPRVLERAADREAEAGQ